MDAEIGGWVDLHHVVEVALAKAVERGGILVAYSADAGSAGQPGDVENPVDHAVEMALGLTVGDPVEAGAEFLWLGDIDKLDEPARHTLGQGEREKLFGCVGRGEEAIADRLRAKIQKRRHLR